ncbi:MAG: hypothetical protein ACC662_09100, partial [Planctomycetota bacterium]
EGNLVAGSARQGITISGATVLRLNRNRVTRAGGPGFVIVNGARVLEMKANAAEATRGPRFVVRNATVGPAAPKK